MNNHGVRTRGAHRRATQDESSTAQVRMLELGVDTNENEPIMYNVNQEPEEFTILYFGRYMFYPFVCCLLYV